MNVAPKVTVRPSEEDYKKAKPIPYGGLKVVGEILVVLLGAVILYSAGGGALWFSTLLVVLAAAMYATNHTERVWFKDYWRRNMVGFVEVWGMQIGKEEVEGRIVDRLSSDSQDGFMQVSIHLPLGGWFHNPKAFYKGKELTFSELRVCKLDDDYVCLNGADSSFARPIPQALVFLREYGHKCGWGFVIYDLMVDQENLKNKSWQELVELLYWFSGLLEATKTAVKSPEVMGVRLQVLEKLVKLLPQDHRMYLECKAEIDKVKAMQKAKEEKAAKRHTGKAVVK